VKKTSYVFSILKQNNQIFYWFVPSVPGKRRQQRNRVEIILARVRLRRTPGQPLDGDLLFKIDALPCLKIIPAYWISSIGVFFLTRSNSQDKYIPNGRFFIYNPLEPALVVEGRRRKIPWKVKAAV
jgi:hypothetical protein